MLIHYKPETGDPQTFDASRLRTSEVQVIERTADRTWADLREGLRQGDVTAMRTVAWVILKRSKPDLRLSGFDPFEDELKVYLDAKEVGTYAEQLFKEFGHDPEQIAEAWSELRAAAWDKDACEVSIKDATVPKEAAPQPEPVAETESPSPTAA